MTTAVDSSVLIAIARQESGAGGWVATLSRALDGGDLVICEVVAAEVSSLFGNEDRFAHFLGRLGIVFDAVSMRTAIEAGRIFKKYRTDGGPRRHLLPDFLVGAHALVQAGQLAAIDRGYLRRYFPRLKILTP